MQTKESVIGRHFGIRSIHLFKKNGARCHSFMALNRAGDMPAADWLSQTR